MFRTCRSAARRSSWGAIVGCLALGLLAAGCAADKELTYLRGGDRELEAYEDVDVRRENPILDCEPETNATATLPPRLLRDRHHDEVWDVTLAEAIHLALANSRVIRTRTEFQSMGNSLYGNPEGVGSVYDPAIRDSGILFGNRGVESALSQFDTNFATSLIWGSSSSLQNNLLLAGGLVPGRSLDQDTAQFATSLTKNLGYGATVALSHNWNYLLTNQPLQLFPSTYTGNVALNYIQPLWSGSGAEFTRIAGPLNTNLQSVSGVNQGVVIARISTDVSVVDFEADVRNMVKDVEEVYWELYLAYRNYHALTAARNAALATWRTVRSRALSGLKGGGTADEAQAREAYFEARSRAEGALAGPASRVATAGDQGLYALELQLRRLCGLPTNDGRIIRPADEPTSAGFVPDWHTSLAEGLTRREEIRRQKWIIKSMELQLRAAENLAHPQLNFVSSYQINGFGNDLFGSNGPSGTPGSELQSAYRTLAQANQTGWNLGFQFTMPLGLRNALSQVRNLELRLVKAREVLATQEQEVCHELASAFQMQDYWYTNAQTNYNRRLASEEHLRATEADYQTDRKPLEFLLRAQARFADAEVDYFRSLVEYNKSLCEIHYRKGTLLENNSIHLAEGLWTPDAYKDALRRAWARTYALDPPAGANIRHAPEAFVAETMPETMSFDAGSADLSDAPAVPAAGEGAASGANVLEDLLEPLRAEPEDWRDEPGGQPEGIKASGTASVDSDRYTRPPQVPAAEEAFEETES